jgi:hypothetical protein
MLPRPISCSCLALAAAAFAAGCGAADYVYVPENASVHIDGLPAAKTDIPPERPMGEVRVATLGVTELENGPSRIPALHVRMVVSNDSDPQPWVVDTRRQLLEIAGQGQSRAAFVNVDAQTVPIISVNQRERRTIDLYFPLPATGAAVRFDLLWEVQTGLRVIADRTTFERVEETDYYGYYGTDVVFVSGWGPGWGPYWWYDPWYPHVAFAHSRPFHYHPHRTIVARGPHGRYVTREHRGRR